MQNIGINQKKEWELLSERGAELSIDLYETDDSIVLQSTIAGIKAKDLDISIEENMLIIKGIRKKPEEDPLKKYLYQECYWGPFSKKIILPEEIDPAKIDAIVQDGILTVRVTKIRKNNKRKIEIKGKE